MFTNTTLRSKFNLFPTRMHATAQSYVSAAYPFFLIVCRAYAYMQPFFPWLQVHLRVLGLRSEELMDPRPKVCHRGFVLANTNFSFTWHFYRTCATMHLYFPEESPCMPPECYFFLELAMRVIMHGVTLNFRPIYHFLRIRNGSATAWYDVDVWPLTFALNGVVGTSCQTPEFWAVLHNTHIRGIGWNAAWACFVSCSLFNILLFVMSDFFPACFFTFSRRMQC